MDWTTILSFLESIETVLVALVTVLGMHLAQRAVLKSEERRWRLQNYLEKQVEALVNLQKILAESAFNISGQKGEGASLGSVRSVIKEVSVALGRAKPYMDNNSFLEVREYLNLILEQFPREKILSGKVATPDSIQEFLAVLEQAQNAVGKLLTPDILNPQRKT